MNKYKQRFCYGAPCSPHHLSSLTLTQHAEALLKSGDFSEARSPCWSPTGSRRLTKQRLQVGPHRRRISTRPRQTLRSVRMEAVQGINSLERTLAGSLTPLSIRASVCESGHRAASCRPQDKARGPEKQSHLESL